MATQMPPSDNPLDSLSGTVERVTFHSEATGFCVLRVKALGHRDLVTVVGTAAVITPGEFVSCEGWWVTDRTYGLQFKTATLQVVPPTSLEGIEKYLGSGMVKGIGPHFAKKLVGAFGDASELWDDAMSQTTRRQSRRWILAISVLSVLALLALLFVPAARHDAWVGTAPLEVEDESGWLWKPPNPPAATISLSQLPQPALSTPARRRQLRDLAAELGLEAALAIPVPIGSPGRMRPAMISRSIASATWRYAGVEVTRRNRVGA